MKKTLIQCAAIIGAFGASILSAAAQDSGTRLTFDIEQRLESTDNLALDLVSAGTTTSATTQLSFGLTSATRTQQFALHGGAALRLVNRPGSATDTLIDDPNLRLSYARQGAHSALEFSASYRRSELDFLNAFENIINDDGEIELPGDFGDLTSTGIRESYGANASLEIGSDAPFGVTFSLGLSGLNYTAITDPDLYDNETVTYGVAARLRFSAITEGTVSLKQSEYDAEDTVLTARSTTTLSFGIKHALSKVLDLDALVGHTVVDTNETVALVTTTTRETGVSGQIGLTYDLPNGSASTKISAKTNQDGTRLGFDIGRKLDLRHGSLSANMGITRLEDQDPELTASLSWLQELPNGRLNARLRRSVSTDSSDSDTLNTAMVLGYSHDLNRISGLNFNLSYAVTDETGPDNQTEQISFSTSYRRALTRDWDINVGYAYQMRDEDTVGRADSQSVFLTLSRSFEWWP